MGICHSCCFTSCSKYSRFKTDEELTYVAPMDPNLEKLRRGLEGTDLEIFERLVRLREECRQLSSDDDDGGGGGGNELQHRLRRLRQTIPYALVIALRIKQGVCHCCGFASCCRYSRFKTDNELIDPNLEKLKSGLVKVDVDILERLARLRQERRQLCTDGNIQYRLARLRGTIPYILIVASRIKQLQNTPDPRLEKLKHLLQEQQQLDIKESTATEEITKHLIKLRLESLLVETTDEERSRSGGTLPQMKHPLTLKEVDILIAQIKSELEEEEQESDSALLWLSRIRVHLNKSTLDKMS